MTSIFAKSAEQEQFSLSITEHRESREQQLIILCGEKGV
jgi:hypothetical protein